MYQELNQPLIDKVYNQKDLIEQQNKRIEEQRLNIKHLDDTVHEKTDSLDVF